MENSHLPPVKVEPTQNRPSGEARRCWQVGLTSELWTLLKRLLPFLSIWRNALQTLERRMPAGFLLDGACRYKFPSAASRWGHVPGACGRLRGETPTNRRSVRRQAGTATQRIRRSQSRMAAHAIGQAHSEAFEIFKGTRTGILSVESGIQK